MTEPFYHVFRMPEAFPSQYCFGDGVPVTFQMVDWFGGPSGLTSKEVEAFILKKAYASGKLLVIERHTGEAWIVEAGMLS